MPPNAISSPVGRHPHGSRAPPSGSGRPPRPQCRYAALSIHGLIPQMARGADGTWSAFVAGVTSADQYKFFVTGAGSTGYKRDPYARSLTCVPGIPQFQLRIPRPTDFPWHDAGLSPTSISTRSCCTNCTWVLTTRPMPRRRPAAQRPGRFLDVLFRIEYLAALGVNAVEPLPIVGIRTSAVARLQRHRLFFAGDGLSGRAGRPGLCALPRPARTAPQRSAGGALSPASSTVRPTQLNGVRSNLPRLRYRGDLRRRLQPRRRRSSDEQTRRSTSSTGSIPATTTAASTSPIRTGPAAWCSRSGSRRSASS